MGSSEDSPVRDWTEEERRKATGETNKDRVERFLQDNHPMLAAYSTDLYRRRLTTLLDEAVRDALLQIRELQSLIMEFLDGCGPRDLHDDGCPEDDTCECPLVKKVNRAMRGYKENDTLKQNDFEPLNPPMTDRWGFEHDMRVGPCSCGAVHTKNDALKPNPDNQPPAPTK